MQQIDRHTLACMSKDRRDTGALSSTKGDEYFVNFEVTLLRGSRDYV